MRAKVVLINSTPIMDKSFYMSQRVYFPYGLLSIATTLRQEAIESTIIDAHHYFSRNPYSEDALNDYIQNNIINKIREINPVMIGIGSLFSGTFYNLVKIAKVIKSEFPDIPIAIGGIHSTIFAEPIIQKYNFIDFVILGEGEESFTELLNCIIDKKSYSHIDGIVFRDSDEVKVNSKTKFIKDLDQIPFVDYTFLNMDDYKNNTDGWFTPKNIKVGQPFTLISSRSCPQQCTFCSMWLVHGKRIRFRSANNVVDEIEFLYNNYNARFFDFYDDNLTFNKKRAMDIFNEVLKRKLDIQFDIPSGLAIKCLDQELIDKMYEAGMSRINISVEHVDDFIRNVSMKKKLPLDKIYEVILASAKHEKLFITCYFVIGMPEETLESLDKIYKMIQELPIDDSTISYATPYPGTELFNYCINNKLLDHNKEYYMDIPYFQHLSAVPHYKPHNISKEDLIQFRQKCLDFYQNKREAMGIPSNIPFRYASKYLSQIKQ